jgi:hypothetical protein
MSPSLYEVLSVVTVIAPDEGLYIVVVGLVVFPDVAVVEFDVPVGFCKAYGEAKTGITPIAQSRIASNANPLKRVLILVGNDFFCYLKLRKKLLTNGTKFGTLPIRYILTSRWIHLSLWISYAFTANVERRF